MEDHFYEAVDEHGDRHHFIGSVGDALKDTGIIFRRDGVWHIRAKDVNIIEEKRMDLAVCDFCAARPVCFDIDADDFTDGFDNHSVGGWAACEACGTLIEAGDRDGLLRRQIATHEHLPMIGVMLRTHLKLFWQHFKGVKRIPPKAFGH